MCGNPIDRGLEKKASVDNVLLTICGSCYQKLSLKSLKQGGAKTGTTASRSSENIRQKPIGYRTSSSSDSAKTKERRPESSRKTSIDEKLELVEDYSERIRRARESFGWDQRTLAVKLKVSENVIKRIESGKLRPTIDLARKLEEVLNIKLLVPAVEDEMRSEKIYKYVTLGEIVDIRDNKG